MYTQTFLAGKILIDQKKKKIVEDLLILMTNHKDS
jgi:hypothetical protein